MGDMLIRGIPDALKLELEEVARVEGKSLSARAIDLMRKGMIFEKEAASKPKRSAWEVLRKIYEEEGAIDDDYAKMMDEIEAERKKDFGRPVDFEEQ